MLETAKLTSLKQVFSIIPMTIVHRDTNIHYATLHRRIQNPRLLTLDNIITIAEWIDVRPDLLLKLALADIEQP